MPNGHKLKNVWILFPWNKYTLDWAWYHFLNYICCSNAVFAVIILETRLKLSQCDDLYIKENHATNAEGY